MNHRWLVLFALAACQSEEEKWVEYSQEMAPKIGEPTNKLLQAAVAGDRGALEAMFADDVRALSPNWGVENYTNKSAAERLVAVFRDCKLSGEPVELFNAATMGAV